MRIGQLAAAAGVPCSTVRFYERTGLLLPPARGANGYRRFDGRAVTRVRFIRAAHSAGLTLRQIRSILDLRDLGDTPCAHVRDLVGDALLDVRAHIGRLAAVEQDLLRLQDRSRNLDPADCTDADICAIVRTSG